MTDKELDSKLERVLASLLAQNKESRLATVKMLADMDQEWAQAGEFGEAILRVAETLEPTEDVVDKIRNFCTRVVAMQICLTEAQQLENEHG